MGLVNNAFMDNLQKQLIEKRNITESSAVQYMQSLYKLNDSKVFSNLGWLKNYAVIDERLKKYALNTQRGYITSIVTMLSVVNMPSHKSIQKHWLQRLMDYSQNKVIQDNKNEKSDKQSENWIDWDEVMSIKQNLRMSLKKFINLAQISREQYEELQKYVILSLYTDMAPRRNQDYIDMYVVDKWKPSMDKTKNYLDIDTRKFIFNKYKTAKTYGEQIIPVPESKDRPLFEALIMMLKHHPLNSTRAKEFKLLVDYEGNALNTVNIITRILNKIFKKKIGASMLRHIYLTSKYGDELTEMKKDSQIMAHSLGEQKNYIVNE